KLVVVIDDEDPARVAHPAGPSGSSLLGVPEDGPSRRVVRGARLGDKHVGTVTWSEKALRHEA
ncbi:MAG TPA: hypothetical protein VFD26_10590, partial [Methyloceanibacter sp.]|nr:hypothetical protein [Methyloceanibacter sp.]